MPTYAFELGGKLYTRECETKEQLLAWIKSLEAQADQAAADQAKKAKVEADLAPYKVEAKNG